MGLPPTLIVLLAGTAFIAWTRPLRCPSQEHVNERGRRSRPSQVQKTYNISMSAAMPKGTKLNRRS